MSKRKQDARPWIALVAAALLTACAAPVLLMPSSGQLMWALLKPLVGFDPNAVNLFEQPIVKQRMTALLGERYTPVLTLLRTADALRQEGPLFFLVSRYTPIPEIADGAGLVWNADTNQLAAVLRRGNVAEVFAEKVQRAVIHDAQAAVQEAVVTAPVWPGALKPWVEAATVIGGGALQESLRAPAPAADQDGDSGS